MSGARTAARVPQILQRLRRAMNMTLNVDQKNNVMTFPIAGFKYDDFDRAGFVNLIKINRMMETSRMGNTERICVKNVDSLTFFMLGTHLEVSEKLYKTAALDYPMKFCMHLSGIGKSSLDAVQSFVEEGSDFVLAQRICRVVNIDTAKKIPAPFSEEIRKSFLEQLHNSKNVRLPQFEIPVPKTDKCFIHEVTVRYADLDLIFHANQGSYFQYAFECAAKAAEEGYYSKIRQDICFYPAKTAAGLHVSESFAGDTLRVLTWEDEVNPLLVYFTIRKNDVDVYYAKVEFFDPENFESSDL